MKVKTGFGREMSKQDAKYLALIDDCLQEFRRIRKDMQRSRQEIDRLKASTRRKLSQIDAILNRA